MMRSDVFLMKGSDKSKRGFIYLRVMSGCGERNRSGSE